MKNKLLHVESEVISRYEAGEGCTALAREFNVQESSICRLLYRHGVQVRQKEKRNARKYTLQETFFDEVTPLSAYWAGFLLADGCVYETRLQVILQPRDEGHLRQLLVDLGADNPIKNFPDGSGRVYRGFALRSRHLVDALAKWGVVERKGEKDLVPQVEMDDASFRAFVTGMLDGDGCVSVPAKKSPSIQFLATPRVLDFITARLAHRLGIRFWRRCRSKIEQATTGAMGAVSLVDWLYRSSPPVRCLVRKQKIALSIKPRAPWVLERAARGEARRAVA